MLVQRYSDPRHHPPWVVGVLKPGKRTLEAAKLEEVDGKIGKTYSGSRLSFCGLTGGR